MRTILWIMLSLLPISVSAAEIKSIDTRAQDPTVLCSVLRNKLPNTLAAIRKFGSVRSEKTTPDTYYCEDQELSCSIHTFEFTGLKLSVLEDKKSTETSTISVEISDSKWRLFGDILIGQKLEVIEERFGVKIPRNISPVVLNGECTPLTIWHENGKILGLELDCHSCI